MRWFTIFLTLTACGDSPGDSSGDSGIGAIDFCERPSIQDGSLGGGFLLNHCTGCHSSENDENQRHGAPLELNYETHAGFSQHLDRVKANCAIDTTHPCDDIPALEVEEFLGWIECGAPSTAADFPVFAEIKPGESFDIIAQVSEEADGFRLTRKIESGSRSFFPETPWSITWFERYGGEVWLFSETLYREDGSVLWAIDFGTGLLISSEDTSLLTDSLEVEIQDDGTLTTEFIDFEVYQGAGVILDGRESNHDPDEIHVTSNYDLEWIWHFGDEGPPTLQASWIDTERSWMALGVQDYQGPLLEFLGLSDRGQWIERVHVTEEWSQ